MALAPFTLRGLLAQLEERQTSNLNVAGSSPVWPYYFGHLFSIFYLYDRTARRPRVSESARTIARAPSRRASRVASRVDARCPRRTRRPPTR